MNEPHAADRSGQPGRVALSVFVLTYNEERNLEACLARLWPWAGEIFLVDSFSKDRTLEIGERYGARVFSNRFLGHSAQRNWALQNLPFRYDWILALDADHRVTPELRDELARLLPNTPPEIVGYFVNRRQVFRGRWIKHGGYYPKYMLKLFRRGAARCDDDEFDYRFYVNGPTGKLRHDIYEDNANETAIGFWIEKHNKFATEQAVEELKRRDVAASYLMRPRLFGNPDERTLWLKRRWYRLPLFVRPFLYFFYRYVIRLGFLDGKQGFIFHFLQAFWFRLLVDIKLEELTAQQASQAGPEPGCDRQGAAPLPSGCAPNRAATASVGAAQGGPGG